MAAKCDTIDKRPNHIPGVSWIRDTLRDPWYNTKHQAFGAMIAERRKKNCYTPDLPMIEARRGHLLFAYGTLKVGFSRHPVLKKMEAIYVGQAITMNGYSMYRTKGDNPFPVILPMRPKVPSGSIVGQLFVVYPRTIQVLDEMEQNGNMYQRISTIVQCTTKPNHNDFQLYGSYRAWTYMGLMPYWNKHITTHNTVEPIEPYTDSSGSKQRYLYFKEFPDECDYANC